MIRLTRLNGEAVLVNADLIKYLEERPDTIVTLLNDERLIVKENAELVVDRVIEYGQRLRAFPRD